MAEPSQPPPNLLQQAQAEYPALRKYNIGYVERWNEKDPGNRALEAWPPGEYGSRQAPRPKELPLDQYGLEIIQKRTTPMDVAGDIVSHFLVNRGGDPQLHKFYWQFINSMTPEQKNHLAAMWMHETGGQGDYGMWQERSGLPAYFRGYAFKQWHPDEGGYTAQQKQMFDQMMEYLKKGAIGGAR